MPLPDGLTLREATDDDIEAIVALETAAFGASDGPAVRAYLAGPSGPASWTVVHDGDRLVSSCGRISHRMSIDGIELPAAQIEYVATDPDYRRRGLIRAQFDRHHTRSADAGDLAQFIGGIPYFYRRLGYGYGLDYSELFLFDPADIEPPQDVQIRPAMLSDLPWIVSTEAHRPTDGLRTIRDAETWGVLFSAAQGNDWEHLLVAESEGAPTGWTRMHLRPEEGRLYLFPSVADSPDTVAAIILRAIELAEPDDLVVIGYDHPGTVFGEQLRLFGRPFTIGTGVYTRIPDPVAMLDRLRPALDARLARSAFDDWTGTLAISLYDSGLALDVEAGSVARVRATPGEEDPFETGGVGVAPDWFGALVFGRWGAAGLAERVDDVLLGAHHHMMEALFPKLTADVIGDF